MESWRTVWRNGVAGCLSLDGLKALRGGLLANSPVLLQGATTQPPPLMCVQDWPCEAADAIGYAFWHGDRGGAATIGEVEEAFARTCFETDQALGEPAACRWFLNWWDDTPRGEAFRELLAEVELSIKTRKREPNVNRG